MPVSSTMHISNKLVELLKCHRYDIETRELSLAVDLHTGVHLTELPHVNFCPVGSLVGIEIYDIQ